MFTHDTTVSLTAATVLINSASAPDSLTTMDDLDALYDRWQWTGSRTHDQAELDGVRALRGRLRAIWLAEEEVAVAQLNELLREGRALPQLVKHDDFDYHIHATSPQAGLATRMMVEYAMALVDVVRAGAFDRLRSCADPSCDNVIIDLSKNRSRRFCDAGCGNRANVAAYRARKSRHLEE
ncbi:MAG: CGNR zinc finger domain-containing protein [Micropruina sp.]